MATRTKPLPRGYSPRVIHHSADISSVDFHQLRLSVSCKSWYSLYPIGRCAYRQRVVLIDLQSLLDCQQNFFLSLSLLLGVSPDLLCLLTESSVITAVQVYSSCHTRTHKHNAYHAASAGVSTAVPINDTLSIQVQ